MRALGALLLAAAAFGADQAVIDRGRAEEKRTCLGCHGVRIIRTQRLSRDNWVRELDKMVRWGTEIKDREALLEFLVATQGDDKPQPKPEISGNGAK
jgi:mono/diheme cytochrome c family protein